MKIKLKLISDMSSNQKSGRLYSKKNAFDYFNQKVIFMNLKL